MSKKEYPAKLTTGYYRVREVWEDEASQFGAYRLLANAKAKCDENPGSRVFDNDGNVIYPEEAVPDTGADMEDYWEELEGDYERREKAIRWMKNLPAGRDGTVAFLNEVTEEHCKAFLLSITIHSPLKFTVHWFDDTKTEVEMDSNIEDYRNTASYYDGHTMRDGSQRKRHVR